LSSLTTAIKKDYEASPRNATPNSQRALDEAEKENLNVVFPKANELQIDIDNEHSFTIFNMMSEILERHYGIQSIRVKPSRSGLPKRHVTVTLWKDVTNMERIALQACMGSDRVREAPQRHSGANGDPHATLFLEKKACN
jgi:hypothetical protein